MPKRRQQAKSDRLTYYAREIKGFSRELLDSVCIGLCKERDKLEEELERARRRMLELERRLQLIREAADGRPPA
jgi:hypothetical protein